MPFILKCNTKQFIERLYDYRLYIELVYSFKEYFITDEMIEVIPKSECVNYLRWNYNLLSELNLNKSWEHKKIRIARKIFEKWSGQEVLK